MDIMNINTKNLFKIGEVVKLTGISRKIILNYENNNLITPAMKDEDTGYRYYTADNITEIRFIRSLQNIGLSLNEINLYLADIENAHVFIKRLTELRDSLDVSINILKRRAESKSELKVHETTLPYQVCYCCEYDFENLQITTNDLRKTYIAAAKTGYMSKTEKMFTIQRNNSGKETRLCAIPMEKAYNGENRVDFPEVPALCVYYRGGYENIAVAFEAIQNYMEEHNIKSAGDFRSIFYEGPPQHGANTANYFTQVAIPIETV